MKTLPSETQDKLDAYCETVKDAKLGNLLRRLRNAVLDLQDGLDKWGHRVQVDRVLGHDIETPIAAEATVELSIRAGDAEPRKFAVHLVPRHITTVEADDDMAGDTATMEGSEVTQDADGMEEPDFPGDSDHRPSRVSDSGVGVVAAEP